MPLKEIEIEDVTHPPDEYKGRKFLKLGPDKVYMLNDQGKAEARVVRPSTLPETVEGERGILRVADAVLHTLPNQVSDAMFEMPTPLETEMRAMGWKPDEAEIPKAKHAFRSVSQFLAGAGVLRGAGMALKLASPNLPAFVGGMKELLIGSGVSGGAGYLFGSQKEDEATGDAAANLGETLGGLTATEFTRRARTWALMKNLPGRLQPLVTIAALTGKMPTLPAHVMGRMAGSAGGYAAADTNIDVPILLSVIGPGVFDASLAIRGRSAARAGLYESALGETDDVSGAAFRVTERLRNQFTQNDLVQAGILNNTSSMKDISRETLYAFTNDLQGQLAHNRKIGRDVAGVEASRLFEERSKLLFGKSQFQAEDIANLKSVFGRMEAKQVFPTRHARDTPQRRGSVSVQFTENTTRSERVKAAKSELRKFYRENPPGTPGRSEEAAKMRAAISRIEREPDRPVSRVRQMFKTRQPGTEPVDVTERFQDGKIVSRTDATGARKSVDTETKLKYLETELSKNPMVKSLNSALSKNDPVVILNELGNIFGDIANDKKKVQQFSDMLSLLREPPKQLAAYLPEAEVGQKVAQKLQDVFWMEGVMGSAFSDPSRTITEGAGSRVFDGDKIADFMDANKAQLKKIYGEGEYQARRDVVQLMHFTQMGSLDKREAELATERIMSFVTHRLVFQVGSGALFAGGATAMGAPTLPALLLGAAAVKAGGKAYVIGSTAMARMAEKSPESIRGLVKAIKDKDRGAQGQFMRALFREGDPATAEAMGIEGDGGAEEPGPVSSFFQRSSRRTRVLGQSANY